MKKFKNTERAQLCSDWLKDNPLVQFLFTAGQAKPVTVVLLYSQVGGSSGNNSQKWFQSLCSIGEICDDYNLNPFTLASLLLLNIHTRTRTDTHTHTHAHTLIQYVTQRVGGRKRMAFLDGSGEFPEYNLIHLTINRTIIAFRHNLHCYSLYMSVERTQS